MINIKKIILSLYMFKCSNEKSFENDFVRIDSILHNSNLKIQIENGSDNSQSFVNLSNKKNFNFLPEPNTIHKLNSISFSNLITLPDSSSLPNLNDSYSLHNQNNIYKLNLPDTLPNLSFLPNLNDSYSLNDQCTMSELNKYSILPNSSSLPNLSDSNCLNNQSTTYKLKKLTTLSNLYMYSKLNKLNTIQIKNKHKNKVTAELEALPRNIFFTKSIISKELINTTENIKATNFKNNYTDIIENLNVISLEKDTKLPESKLNHITKTCIKFDKSNRDEFAKNDNFNLDKVKINNSNLYKSISNENILNYIQPQKLLDTNLISNTHEQKEILNFTPFVSGQIYPFFHERVLEQVEKNLTLYNENEESSLVKKYFYICLLYIAMFIMTCIVCYIYLGNSEIYFM